MKLRTNLLSDVFIANTDYQHAGILRQRPNAWERGSNEATISSRIALELKPQS